MAMETKRIFLAVKIEAGPELNKVYTDLKETLKYEKINWVKAENLHLTLKFFGDTYQKEIDEIILKIKTVTEDQIKFSMILENTGVFGSRYDPRVIWAGLSKTEALLEMVQKINSQLQKIGYYQDRQNFIPHLTLARIKNLSDKHLFQHLISKYQKVSFQSVEVNKIFLFESILQRQGPLYKVIYEFPLKA